MGIQPQPLTSVLRKEPRHYHFGLLLPTMLPNGAELSWLVLSTLNAYAIIDSHWASIFVYLLHADPKTGNAVYNGVSSAEAKRAAIEKAAKERLSADDYSLFMAVVSVVHSLRNRRNAFAHGLWGVSEDIQDALLLAESKTFADQEVGRIMASKRMAQTRKLEMPPPLNLSEIMVYRKAALEHVNREANKVMEIMGTLAFALMANAGSSIGDPLRQRLLGYPQIQEALQRSILRNNRQAQPKPRRKSRKKKR